MFSDILFQKSLKNGVNLEYTRPRPIYEILGLCNNHCAIQLNNL